MAVSLRLSFVLFTDGLRVLSGAATLGYFIFLCYRYPRPFFEMAALLARALYPSAETVTGWADVNAVVAWSGIAPASWNFLMDKAGATEEGLSAMIICGLPVHIVVDIIGIWKTERAPTYAEQVKAALTFNGVRLMFGLELLDFLPPPAPPHTQVQLPLAPTAALHPTTTSMVKIKLSQIIDQGTDQEVPMLDAATLTRYRDRFQALNGDSPLQKVEVYDAQLSALDFRVRGLGPLRGKT